MFAREISTLVSSSADAVAKCLAAQNGSVLSAVGKSLSQNAACQVIHALKNRKLLTGKILNLLHPWYHFILFNDLYYALKPFS